MIKATIGESKPQQEPFPKLMKGHLGTIILAITAPNEQGRCVVLNLTHFIFTDCFKLDGKEKFTDYSEPITLQNE